MCSLLHRLAGALDLTFAFANLLMIIMHCMYCPNVEDVAGLFSSQGK